MASTPRRTVWRHAAADQRIRSTDLQRTIVQKILDAHRIHDEGGRSLLYVDRLIVADTALPAFNTLKSRGLHVRKPVQALLISDHYAASSGPTLDDVVDVERRDLIRATEGAARGLGIETIGIGDPRRGIQHIVAVEQAYAQPGITLVAADSHTSTEGAVGALAFSIGADLPHVLATQCLWLKLPRMMRINLDGELPPGASAKDVALALMTLVGSDGALGHAIEYAGSFIRRLSLEGRMTICNMAVEMGGLIGVVAPDETTFSYLRGRPFAPTRADWDNAVAFWKTLPTDEGAAFDREVTLDVVDVAPMVTWGNSPEDAVPITGFVPDPANETNPDRRAHMMSSLAYMGLRPGARMSDITIDQVFIGSCMNARIEDLREAAKILRGQKVAVPTLVVPGSGLVKAQAAAEGLDAIFLSAGARWGEAGCSMCVAMNGDTVPPGMRCASTSNRNHIGRQGRGSRTHLMSPAMAAAAAVSGRLRDVRELGVH
jgi:3-isopropylmalate/(R)-2-methylmalate dehydratase large subunit